MLLPYFQAIEASALSKLISTSPWAFAVIESVHLLALAVIGGAVLMLDFRFLGVGLIRQPIREIAREAQPWLIASLIVMLVTGFFLFVSEPIKCYYSKPFWLKMTSLSLAMLFTFTVRRKAALADEARVRPVFLRMVALVSLTLWFGVGAAGRWIGFSG